MPILTINAGSSSLKAGLYADDGRSVLLTAKAEELGKPSARLTLALADGRKLPVEATSLGSSAEALAAITAGIQRALPEQGVTAVGHRIVHGGPRLREHCRLTPEVLRTLREAVHFAPLHLPGALALVDAAAEHFPSAPQFACFDTQFHTTLEPNAYTYALPRVYRDAGVRRYGFHGLSYESAVRTLGAELPERTVVAHLGSGSSVCAIRNGRSVDTSMGLSPDGGVPMATRTGDLDPAVVLLLTRGLPGSAVAMGTDAVEQLLNHASGLEALAGTGDVRQLTARARSGDADAELALQIFARAIAKTVASYAAVLGGLEMLVFTGGIGENSAEVRRRVCDHLGFLGVQLDAERNGPVLSATGSRVQVRTVPADEDGQIARHVAAMLSSGS